MKARKPTRKASAPARAKRAGSKQVKPRAVKSPVMKKAAKPKKAAKAPETVAVPVAAVLPEVATAAAAVPAAPAPVATATAAPASTEGRRAGLKLEPSCTLRDALDMQFQLLSTDFGDADVLLDGSAVERIDTAGLQMLVSFAKYHAVSGKRMQWAAASQELQRGSRLLGLDEALGLVPAPPETCGGH